MRATPPAPAPGRRADPAWRAWLVPGLGDVVFVATFLVLLAVRAGLLGDGDTAWHIRTGALILDTGRVPRVDPFSFLDPPPAWTAHEWLSEVIMAGLHRAGGLAAVATFFAAVLAATIHQTFALVRGRGVNLFAAVAATGLALGAAKVHFLARPHAFTMLFFVVWLRLLDARARGAPPSRLALLPLGMLIWVNLHAGAIVGLFLVGLALLGARTRAEAGPLAAALGASIVAACANPHGPALLLFPFELQGTEIFMTTVGEFMPPSTRSAPLFLPLVALVAALLARAPGRTGRGEVAGLLLFAYMGSESVRYTALFALYAAAPLGVGLDALLAGRAGRVAGYVASRSAAFGAIDARSRGAPLATAALVAAAVAVGRGGLPTAFPPRAPLAAIAHLRAHPVPGNGFHSDEYGDFLVYAGWPQLRVFIDGRLDMYGGAWLETYRQVADLAPGWEAILARYGVRWILYPKDAVFARALRFHPGWRVSYEDDAATLFVRR